MDFIRKIKKSAQTPPASNGDMESESLHVDDVEKSDSHEDDDAMMKSIDDLVDSSSEEAEIFDDDEDELQTPSKSVASLASSSNKSARSFKEVAMHITGGTTPQFLSVPKTVQHGAMKDLDNSSRSSRESLGSSKSDESDDLLSDGDDRDEDSRSKEKDHDDKGSDSAEDYTDDEDEGQDGYKAGGYHPVKVGEIYNQR
jgi:hypothetical protein